MREARWCTWAPRLAPTTCLTRTRGMRRERPWTPFRQVPWVHPRAQLERKMMDLQRVHLQRPFRNSIIRWWTSWRVSYTWRKTAVRTRTKRTPEGSHEERGVKGPEHPGSEEPSAAEPYTTKPCDGQELRNQKKKKKRGGSAEDKDWWKMKNYMVEELGDFFKLDLRLFFGSSSGDVGLRKFDWKKYGKKECGNCWTVCRRESDGSPPPPSFILVSQKFGGKKDVFSVTRPFLLPNISHLSFLRSSLRAVAHISSN